MSFTKISEIGEFGLIDKISTIVSETAQQTPLLSSGIGDDCAVYVRDKDTYEVITTDLLIEHVHFDLLTTPMEHLGGKSLSVNVSDICAMNATPLYAVVSIAIPNSISVEMIEAFYTGMKNAAMQYGVAIAGGDTSASSSGLMISVTVVGEVSQQKLVKRNTAKPGDFICISGELGGSNAGLLALMREKQLMLDHMHDEQNQSDFQTNLEDYKDAVSRHLLPKARLDVVKKLAQLDIVPTAMIDVSDGLASETKHICRQSKTGAVLFENKIPIMSHAREIADEFKDDVISYALFGGEDYEILFTVSPNDLKKIEEKDDLTIIGQIKPEDEGIKLADMFGKTIDLEKLTGFQHFIPHKDDEDLTDEEDIWGEEN